MMRMAFWCTKQNCVNVKKKKNYTVCKFLYPGQDILVNMLKKERQKGAGGGPTPRSSRRQAANEYSSGSEDDRHQGRRRASEREVKSQQELQPLLDKDDRMKTKICKSEFIFCWTIHSVQSYHLNAEVEEDVLSLLIIFNPLPTYFFRSVSVGQMSLGRQEAFDLFMRDYEHQQQINDNKRILKDRYTQAKTLGMTLNSAKQRISMFGFPSNFAFFFSFVFFFFSFFFGGGEV